MTAIDRRRAPGSSFCRIAAIGGSILAFALCSGSVGADDAEIAKLLKTKGAEVTESVGIVTALSIPDGSKLTDDNFRQIPRLNHLKLLSLSNGLNDERL